MKEKTVLFRVFLAALAAALVLSASAVILAFGESADSRAEALQEEYRIGTVLEVPQMNVTVGGKEYPAETIVYYPGGSAYNSSTITLSEMGLYRVENRAEVDGKFYREYKTFSVYDNLYTTEGGVNATAEYTPSPIEPDVNGIYLRLDSGSVFRYNKVIDLNALGANTPVFSSFYSPEKLGEMDALTFWITLTDIYDPDNYVTVKCNATRDGIGHGVTYLLAGAAYQPLTGVEWNLGKVHRDNIYGFAISANFYGIVDGDNANNGVDLYYDTQTNKIMSKFGGGGSNLIVDLDDPEYFSDPFQGFTTGEVFLSIYATDLEKSTFGLEIKSIADHDLSVNKLTDDTTPTVMVDYGEFTEETVPEGLVGNPYPLFGASAVDEYNGSLKVSARVYENYYSSHKTEVAVKDGAFVPDRAGRYTIEYSATDWSGNTRRVPVDINVKDKVTELKLTVEEEGRVTKSFVGEWVDLSVAEVTGGVGGESVRIVVLDPSGNEIQAEDRFLPESSGKYTVRYVATDYVSQTAEYEYEVEVTYGSNPVFNEEAALPRYFVTGSEYTLPALKAKNYTQNGSSEIETTIRVKDGAGERTIGVDRKVTFVGGDDVDEAIVTYIAVTSTGKTEKSYSVPLYNVKDAEGLLHMENYFDMDGFGYNGAEKEYVYFGTAGGNSTAKVTFVNPVIAYGLELNFLVNTAKNAYDTVNVYLEDSVSGQVLKFTYRRNAAVSSFCVNDGSVTYSSLASFTNSGSNEFRFRFDNANSRVSSSGDGEYIKVTTTADGKPFSGFESGLVYITVEIANVTGASELFIGKINSQPFGNAVLDRVVPEIYVLGNYGGSVAYGSEVKVNDVLFADVLDPNPSITLTVAAPNGDIVVSKDGLKLENVPVSDYAFVLDQFGSYRVTFKATDWRDSSTLSYSIFVLDNVAPEIVPNGEMKSEAKIGDIVVVPSVTATDNVSAADKIVISTYVFNPYGRLIALPGNSFEATVAGDYRVVIAARDEAGNIGMKEFTITVKEG